MLSKFQIFLIISSIIISLEVWYVNKMMDEDSERNKAQEIANKDKMIHLDTNKLGCKQYSYNKDIIWTCPKGLGVVEIERKVCGVGKNQHICRTVFDPVLTVDK